MELNNNKEGIVVALSQILWVAAALMVVSSDSKEEEAQGLFSRRMPREREDVVNEFGKAAPASGATALGSVSGVGHLRTAPGATKVVSTAES